MPPGGQNLPQGNLPNGDCPVPSGGQGFPHGDGGNDGQNNLNPNGGKSGGQPGSMGFGTSGTLRLFTNPLVGEASWLLPFVLGGLIVLVTLLARKRPFDGKHAALILWVDWLLPEAIHFTYSTELMHAYYLIMLGAPLVALLANTAPGTYLLATGRANDAASYILDTGRPVLTFGGFLGEYQEVSVGQLSALVESGQLRFVLSQGAQHYPEIFQWVQQNCKTVDTSNLSGTRLPGGQVANSNLYDCGK